MNNAEFRCRAPGKVDKTECLSIYVACIMYGKTPYTSTDNVVCCGCKLK